MNDAIMLHNPICSIEHVPPSQDSDMGCYIDLWPDAFILIPNKRLEQINSFCFCQGKEPTGALGKHLPLIDFCIGLLAYWRGDDFPESEEYALLIRPLQ